MGDRKEIYENLLGEDDEEKEEPKEEKEEKNMEALKEVVEQEPSARVVAMLHPIMTDDNEVKPEKEEEVCAGLTQSECDRLQAEVKPEKKQKEVKKEAKKVESKPEKKVVEKKTKKTKKTKTKKTKKTKT